MIDFFGARLENKVLCSLYKDEFFDLASSGISLQGDNTIALEEYYSFHHKGSSKAAAVGSATDGLFFLLKSLALPRGSKVAVTSFTFIASGSCIKRAGYDPVFIDVDEYGNMSLDHLAEVTGIDALVAVSLFGKPLDFNRLIEICEAKNILVIEDAAQLDFPIMPGFRSEVYHGSVVSYDPTKIFSGFGSGGLVISHCLPVIDYVKKLRYHGNGGELLGYNSQISELSAWLILKKILHHNESWAVKRAHIAENFNKALKYSNGIRSLADPLEKHSLHKYVLKCRSNSQRNRLIDALSGAGVPSRVHYTNPLPYCEIFKNINDNMVYENAETLSSTCLSLPIYPLMSNNDQKIIISCLNNFVKNDI